MQTPTWFTPALLGAFGGAVALAIAGFGGAGWMTSAKANVLASEQANDEVMAALLPICLNMANEDPMSAAKIAEMKGASSYQRSQLLAQTGWATMPGSSEPNSKLARLCATQLVL